MENNPLLSINIETLNCSCHIYCL